MPRPHDPGSRPKGPRQTNPHARGAYKKSGELPTALSLCVEARGSSCDLAETRMGSANEPSVQTKRICEGRMKKSEDPRPSSCSRRRLGAPLAPKNQDKKHDKRHRAHYGPGVQRLGLQRGFDSRPRATESGTTSGRAYEWPRPERTVARGVLSRVRDRQESIRMGSHRREAPSHRGPRTASAPTRETPWYSWSASLDH